MMPRDAHAEHAQWTTNHHPRAIFFSTHIDDARYPVILHEQHLISPIGPKVVAPLRSDSFFSAHPICNRTSPRIGNTETANVHQRVLRV